MTARRFVMIISSLLLIAGVWGLFSPVVLGMISTNPIQASIHLALGAFL